MSTPAPTVPANTEPTTQPTPTPSASAAPNPTFTQEQLDAIIADRLARQQRAIDAKATKDKESAEADRLAKQGEYQKLAETAQAEAATLKATLAARDYADLQRTVAAAHKLPESLASRLTGTTREELEADAKQLATLIAQPAAPPTPGNKPSPRPQAGPSGAPDTEAYLKGRGIYNI